MSLEEFVPEGGQKAKGLMWRAGLVTHVDSNAAGSDCFNSNVDKKKVSIIAISTC